MTITPPRSQLRPVSVPEPLNRYLSTSTAHDVISMTAYVDRGAELVSLEALGALWRLRQPLETKIRGLSQSERLRTRLELLARYFDEAMLEKQGATAPVRCATFALLYFLKGFDRIPDTVPEVGLLDDALVVDLVLQRHATTLRAHWLRHRRAWPLEP